MKGSLFSSVKNQIFTSIWCNSSNFHNLHKCNSFLKMLVSECCEFIKNKLCFNSLVLNTTHSVKNCSSNCTKRHHTLLHFFNQLKGISQSSAPLESCVRKEESAVDHSDSHPFENLKLNVNARCFEMSNCKHIFQILLGYLLLTCK